MKRTEPSRRPLGPKAARIIANISCALFASSAQAEGHFPAWPVQLQSDVVKLTRAFPGELALYIKDLSDNTRYEYNSATPMYLASGIKVPVMVALFRAAKNGDPLAGELTYLETDVRDGAPLVSYVRPGTPIAVRALVEAMIQQSDNAATDLLIGHVGLEQVNRALVEEGFSGFGPITTLIDVRRKVYRNLDPATNGLTPQQIASLGVVSPVEARLAKLAEIVGAQRYTKAELTGALERYYAEGHNTASMQTMGALLEGLARGVVVSPEASKKMVEIMLGTQTGLRRIKGGLPSDIPWAHKTGTQYGRIADFGIMYLSPERPVVIACAVKGGKSREQAEAIMAQIAERTFWHLATPEQRLALDAEARAGDLILEDELLTPEVGNKKKKKKRGKKRKVLPEEKINPADDFE